LIDSKIVLIAAAALMCAASPALAQSFDSEEGSGNVLQFGYGSTAPKHGQIAVRQDGLSAFAMQPGVPSLTNPNDPVNTGGGSASYNRNLYNY
jgi:hypothetical protein